jgi:ketopantoate reductase
LTRPIFIRNLNKMTLNSMAQDIQRGRHDTELEDLNGYILQLAAHHGVDVPINRAVYALCREAFATEPFTPMGVREVWQRTKI